MSFRDLETSFGARLRELAAVLPDYAVLVDRERRYKWVNRIAEGLTEQQILGSRVDEFVGIDDRAEMIEAIERCFEAGEATQYRVSAYGNQGESFFYESRVVPFLEGTDEPLALILTTDRTKEVKAERRFRKFLEASPDYIFAIDHEGTIIYANRAHPTMDRAAVIGKNVLDIVPENTLAAATIAVNGALENRESSEWESSSNLPGSEHVVTRILPIDGPEEARALVIVQDVSERVRVARALQASEDRLTHVMGATAVGLYEIDLTTRVGDISPAFAERLGISNTAKMDEWLSRIHPEEREATRGLVETMITGDADMVELEYRLRMRDGAYRRFHDQMTRTGKSRVAGFLNDVTEVRALEAHKEELQRQLEQTQRLESIGLLAGGVAHDFNNLLTVIISATHLATKKLEAGKAATEELAHVSTAAARGAQLTQQLLAFSCRSTLSVAPVDLASVVEHVVAMTRRLIPETIAIALEAPAGVAVVKADRQQLEQALLNLCINARDAMPEGGTVEISVARENEEAVIEVTDSGHGISDKDLERVFEPFFTTKPVGSGSGLGLSMVHGIVQQHGGKISTTSREGFGTTFEIRLPLSDALPKEHAQAKVGTASGIGRILVAEDEPTVLEIVTYILEDAGYEVVATRDGCEAVEAFVADEGHFDLLLFDAVMPRLTGWMAYRQIRELAPEIPVLFCSGYSGSAFPSDLVEPPTILSKPYEPSALLKAIAVALDTH